MDIASISVLVAVAIVFIFLACGIPIGVTLGIAGVVGAIVFTGRPETGLGIPLIQAVSMCTTYGFIVLPMFMLMGSLAAQAGIARDLFDAAHRWVGRLPGGLAVSTVVTCAGMAAITGSGVATAAAMTGIALPELRRYKYKDSLSIGTITVGGTLAIMIPPSVTFIIYAIFAEQSIGKLLISGILPGLLIAALYSIQVIIRCIIQPDLGPAGPRFSWRERLRSLLGVLPFLLTLLFIWLGIMFGIWTPVEASAGGVVLVFIMGLSRRRLNLRPIISSLIDAVLGAASVMVVVIGALTFSTFLALSGYSETITKAIVGLGLHPFELYLVLIFIYFILGMFMEATSIIALTVPIFMPVVNSMGWDPIWFGVILVCMMEVAAVTPPVGLNLYAVKAAAPDIPTETIYKGAIPFWVCNIIAILILYLVPQIALFLPNRMIGG